MKPFLTQIFGIKFWVSQCRSQEVDNQGITLSKKLWLEDENKVKHLVDFDQLMFIQQSPVHSRKRIFYFENLQEGVTVALQWIKCLEYLHKYDLDYFVTNSKAHIVVRKYVIGFDKPIVILKPVNIINKLEVTAERIKPFEAWLLP